MRHHGIHELFPTPLCAMLREYERRRPTQIVRSGRHDPRKHLRTAMAIGVAVNA